jgi:hypothetical protein
MSRFKLFNLSHAWNELLLNAKKHFFLLKSASFTFHVNVNFTRRRERGEVHVGEYVHLKMAHTFKNYFGVKIEMRKILH